MYFGAKPDLFRIADMMRENPTEAEKILRKKLKRFRSEGYIFRRQHPIDFYIADFYCHKVKLIIEGIGQIHENENVKEHDDSRTGKLERFGLKIARFTNYEVINNN
jgi:very-short-patch-repair endonuclease